MRKSILLLPAMALLLAPISAQTVQTMPNTLPATFGGNAFPFGGVYANSEHCQFIYDGSNFSQQGPILISRLRFLSTAACTGGTATNVTIKLSTCPVAWDKITTTYAANMTAATTVTIVNNATVKFTQTAAAGWALDLQLSTPYLYDPTKGGLCFDWERLSTGTLTGGFTAAIAGTAAAPLKGSRTYGSAGTPTAAGLTASANGYACAAEVTYIPAKGLYSSFTADKTSGPGPLTVTFKDTTYSSAGPVKGWAWDFDGDNKIDSNLQNPSFTYPKTTWDATYDVSLSTTDGTHPLSKVTYKAYITVDPSNASSVNFGAGSTNVPQPGPIKLPNFTSLFTSTAIRGFYFQAPAPMVITGLRVPQDHTLANQTISLFTMPAKPPAYSATYTVTATDQKFFTSTAKANALIQMTPPIVIKKDEWVGILGAGYAGSGTTVSTCYATPSGPYKTSIGGLPVTISRLLMQGTPTPFITNLGLGPVSTEDAGPIGRVEVFVVGNVITPLMTTVGRPALGTTASLDLQANISGAQGGVVLLSAGRLPVPIPTMFGNLLVTPQIFSTIFVANGTGTVPIPVPNQSALTGVTLDWQGLVFNMTSKVYGMSNGSEWFLGK